MLVLAMSPALADTPDTAEGLAGTPPSESTNAFPESAGELWALNRTASLLPDGGIYKDGVGDSEAYRKARGKLDGKKLAVYAAPSKKAARMAGGRASVRFDDSVLCMGAQDRWVLCAYEVDALRWRMGYIYAPELARAMEDSGYVLSLGGVRGTLAEDTALTDDPFAWGDAQPVRLSAGTEVIGLAWWDDEYAYVEARSDGKALRGLVPLRAFNLPEPETDEDMTRLLEGTQWVLRGGGEMAGDVVRFDADGVCTMELFDADAQEGSTGERLTLAWSVSRYDAALSLFWDNAPYMLTLCGEDCSITRMGLTLTGGDRLSLIDSEGSGVYERIDGGTEK